MGWLQGRESFGGNMAKPLTKFQLLLAIGQRLVCEEREGVSAGQARAMGAYVCHFCGRPDDDAVVDVLQKAFAELAANLPGDFPKNVVEALHRCIRVGSFSAHMAALAQVVDMDGDNKPSKREALVQAYLHILRLLREDLIQDGIDIIGIEHALGY